jgi:hypothetical protein
LEYNILNSKFFLNIQLSQSKNFINQNQLKIMKHLQISVLCLLFIFGCKKDNETSVTKPRGEGLNDSELAIIEKTPDSNPYTLNDVILPNGLTVKAYLLQVDPAFYANFGRINAEPYEGLGPQDARNLLIARISTLAFNLIDRSKHTFPDEGPNKPAQNGLGYSFGSKEYDFRQKPPGSSTCTQEIRGLDCSGFIYQVFKYSGVTIPTGRADDQRKATTLQTSIKAAIPALEKVKVEELGKIDIAKFESGDIISWMTSGVAFHIGIILNTPSGLKVLASNGNANSASDCALNIGSTRGPRTIDLTNPYWFNSKMDYSITRINAEISGKYDMALRCQGSSTDAIKLQMNFPTSSQNDFNLSGTGTDYDGQSIKYTGSFSYDNTTNQLTGNFKMTKPSFPNFYRNDSFKVKLSRDVTAYFNLTLGDNEDAGCPVEAKLVNKE